MPEYHKRIIYKQSILTHDFDISMHYDVFISKYYVIKYS